MKAVILAGGLGTRISEETSVRPKPMIEIGGMPILWHIMKIYSAHGITDFIVCCGYKGYIIKEYFANYLLHVSDVTFDFVSKDRTIHQSNSEPWRVTLVDTGEATMTGGRLRRIRDYLGKSDFCFTYGDGVGDINIRELVNYHKLSGRKATVTAVQPLGRFGRLGLEGKRVTSFQEKPTGDGDWINGGFFVCSPSALDCIKSDSTVWEKEPLESLAANGELAAFFHRGFWHPLDTLRDKLLLEELWVSGKAAWKVWT